MRPDRYLPVCLESIFSRRTVSRDMDNWPAGGVILVFPRPPDISENWVSYIIKRWCMYPRFTLQAGFWSSVISHQQGGICFPHYARFILSQFSKTSCIRLCVNTMTAILVHCSQNVDTNGQTGLLPRKISSSQSSCAYASFRTPSNLKKKKSFPITATLKPAGFFWGRILVLFWMLVLHLN